MVGIAGLYENRFKITSKLWGNDVMKFIILQRRWGK